MVALLPPTHTTPELGGTVSGLFAAAGAVESDREVHRVAREDPWLPRVDEEVATQA